MGLDLFEKWVGRIGAVAGLLTVAIALWQGVWQGLRHTPGRTTGMAGKVLRAPMLVVFGFVWIGLLFVLWRPLPLTLSNPTRAIALAVGTLLYFLGLALYLWGGYTLGEMYKPSTSLGVQLNLGHRLVTHGPFAYVRHPLYLGLQVAGLGGLVLYRNWTFAFVFVGFLGLVLRARREEQALAAEFGEEWDDYCQQVPAWLPRFRQ